MISTYETMISILQVWFEGDDSFLSNFSNSFLQISYVLTFTYQSFQNCRIQLFWWCLIILKLLAWCFEPLRILIQREISQMHIQILDIVVIWFFVIVCAESSKTLVAKICLNWINASDEDVNTAVELLLVENEWVVYVPLSQKFVMEGWFWEISELFEQDNAITSTSFWWFGNKCLAWVLPHVMLKISNLIRKQKRVGHKFIINREKSL